VSRTGLSGACPQCGGPLHFGGASSLVSICVHCRSAIARSDASLEWLGQVPDLVATDTRLAIGASGRIQGDAFAVLGRARLSEGRAEWDEWYVVWSDGDFGWLAEAQGRLIVTRRVDLASIAALPPLERLTPGMRLQIEGLGELAIEQVGRATLVSAQGELPFTPQFDASYRFVDASLPGGGYVTLDYGSGDERLEVFAGHELSYEDAGMPELAPGAGDKTARGQALECPSCGAPLSLKAADTKSVVCPSCRGLCDVRKGKLALIAMVKSRATPALPLGAQGTLLGQQLEVIGWLRRGCTVDGVSYHWSEYLLHGKSGYRWLSESAGHWTFLQPLPAASVKRPGERRIHVGSRTYKHFQRSDEVRYEAIQGEFYWELHHGEHARTDDYVAPPYICCREIQEGEEQWTHGEYVAADLLWRSFGLAGDPPAQDGVSPCQPNPYRPRARRIGKSAAYASGALVLLAALLGFALPRERVLSLTVPVAREPQIAISEPFEIQGSTHALELEASLTTPWSELQPTWGSAPWVGLDVSLIDERSGRADTVGLELWRAGRESQEIAREKVGSISPGRYVLRLETVTAPGSSAATNGAVQVVVTHGAFLWFPLFAGFGLLLGPVAFLALRGYLFENRRWRTSDYGSSS
jgi:hypothetical protein